MSQRVKWGGGSYDATWSSTRFATTNIFNTFNPSFGANMTLSYTQPLLRGFRTDPQRTQLLVSRIDRDISDIDLEQTVANTLADVRLAYWELVYARAAVGVQQQALELAEQLVRDNRARVEIGTLDVRIACDVTVRILACPSSPRYGLSSGERHAPEVAALHLGGSRSARPAARSGTCSSPSASPAPADRRG